MTAKLEAKAQVAQLVERYRKLSDAEKKRYNEENTKQSFILPLARALGWNVEERREVTAEDQVSRGRVDYAFRIEGIPKFFLEAKPLKADLGNPQYAWQAINYAWTKGVTWAVFTDFEGMKVFNAEWKGTRIQDNLFFELGFKDYLKRFDQLWLLSRPAFEKGLLDAEAERWGKKAKRQPVGRQLFADLIEWRKKMHRQLRQWNKKYSSPEIDEAVQRILDRLIFIRAAEDRELEPRTLIAAVREWRENGHRKELDASLKGIFREFDKKYDSELFESHFSENLTYDSTSYAQIIEGLYGIRDGAPFYLFDAIDADVMGGIYEQYLSFTQGEVELEEKRARRKKMGIYYTPQFVVKYIVEHTLGRLLKDRTHDQIRKLRVLDPACGSGSFLIEAFDVLDRYHREVRGAPRKNDEMVDFLERMRILKENLYGVDLDPQAIEIARLNLLIKALNQRALLPRLEDNLRVGNSLISGFPEELTQYFGADYEAKRPFNWKEEFPKIMKEGGFDVIIGNPPYVRIQTLDRQEVKYYNDRYQAATGNYDIYTLFVERGWQLLKPGGMLGMILPNKFMQASYGKGLRSLIAEHRVADEIVDFADAQIFETGTTYTCLLFLQKAPNPKLFYIPAKEYVETVKGQPSLSDARNVGFYVDANRLDEGPWTIASPLRNKILDRLNTYGENLGEITSNIFQGIRTSANDVYVLEVHTRARNKKTLSLYSRALDRIVELEREPLWPLLRGEEIKRYTLATPTRYVLVPYEIVEGRASLIFPKTFRSKYPLCWNYLSQNKAALKDRERGRMDHEHWYGYIYPKNLNLFSTAKIVTPDIASRASFALDSDGSHSFVTGYGIILNPTVNYDLRFILGLLNSKALDFYLRQISTRLRGGFYRYFTQFLKQLPIRHIDFSNPQDRRLHDRMVELVKEMLDLQKRRTQAPEGSVERAEVERRIGRVDREIDELVYKLYGITEEEQKVIEG